MVPKLPGAFERRLEKVGRIEAGDNCVVNPFRVEGVLLQYWHSLGDLSSIVDNVLRSQWQRAIHDALAIQREIEDRDVLNMNVRSGNFLVCRF